MGREAHFVALEERTGLARSTIRYHVSRLTEIGVCEKVSNLVLVVFPSLAVLDEAEAILRRIYPDDQVDDMTERAEERRERRENRDDPGSVGDQEERDDPVTLRYLRENHLPKLEQYNLVDIEQGRGSKRYSLVGVDHTAPTPQSWVGVFGIVASRVVCDHTKFIEGGRVPPV